MKKFFCGLGIAFAAILIIGLPIFFGATPAGKTIWNNWFHSVQEADDKIIMRPKNKRIKE